MSGYDAPLFWDAATDWDTGLISGRPAENYSQPHGFRSKSYREFLRRYGQKKKPVEHDWHKIEEDRRAKLKEIIKEQLMPQVPVEKAIEVAEKIAAAPLADVAKIITDLNLEPDINLELLLLSEFL